MMYVSTILNVQLCYLQLLSSDANNFYALYFALKHFPAYSSRETLPTFSDMQTVAKFYHNQEKNSRKFMNNRAISNNSCL